MSAEQQMPEAPQQDAGDALPRAPVEASAPERSAPAASAHAAHQRKMDHGEILALPLRHYEGPVHVVSEPAAVEEAVHAMSRETLLGFDTETRPTFRKGDVHPPALIQLAGHRAVYLFQLRHVGLPRPLQNLLADPRVVKAGVALARDLKELTQFAPFHPAGFVDLGDAARRAGLQHHGLRGLCAVLLGFRISKGAQRSDWSRPALSPQQVTYAATDAWCGRLLYLRAESMGLLSAPAAPAP